MREAGAAGGTVCIRSVGLTSLLGPSRLRRGCPHPSRRIFGRQPSPSPHYRGPRPPARPFCGVFDCCAVSVARRPRTALGFLLQGRPIAAAGRGVGGGQGAQEQPDRRFIAVPGSAPAPRGLLATLQARLLCG